MKRVSVIALLATVGCWDKPGHPVIVDSECSTCHMPDYDATTNPRHTREDGFGTGCENCHTYTAWRPAVRNGHPEADFPRLTNHHQPILCIQCHKPERGADRSGVNTDCVGCHTGTHERVAMDTLHARVTGYPTGTQPPNFCLNCHPDGLAEARQHPEDRFPLMTNDHGMFDCAECHDRERGFDSAANTDCVGCHTGEHSRAREDAQHVGVTGYPSGAAEPNFCLECHEDGRN